MVETRSAFAVGGERFAGIRLPEKTMDDIDRRARRTKVTRSEAIRRLVEIGLKAAPGGGKAKRWLHTSLRSDTFAKCLLTILSGGTGERGRSAHASPGNHQRRDFLLRICGPRCGSYRHAGSLLELTYL
jgi:hypothetical protein